MFKKCGATSTYFPVNAEAAVVTSGCHMRTSPGQACVVLPPILGPNIQSKTWAHTPVSHNAIPLSPDSLDVNSHSS